MTIDQINVKDAIEAHKGMTHAISRAELCRVTGLTDRKLRLVIHELRLQGWPIGSSSSVRGYWWIWSPEEKAATIRDLKAHAFQTLAVMNRLEKRPLYIKAEKAMQAELGL